MKIIWIMRKSNHLHQPCMKRRCCIQRNMYSSLKGSSFKKKKNGGASLVAQWLRICLPMQGTRVRALAREDPTCRGATKPVHHNYWAWAPEPASHNYWAHVPQLMKPARLEPMFQNKRGHNEKPAHRNKE